jgi:ABC-2 type transport system permease protein
MSLRTLLDVYRTQYKIALVTTFQYRVMFVMQLLYIMIEPVVYLVVWQVAARSSGGDVAGYTADDFALYFIMWSLVRQFTVAWDPSVFEWRIRDGELNQFLLRPVHIIHLDTAQMIGWKTVELVALVPTLAVLWLVFRPAYQPVLWAIAAFIPALALGFVLRYVMMYDLALVTFWTTRLSALYRAYFLVEFFVSGRIAPLGVLPPWLQTIASVLPFKWMFGFPLELVLGHMSQQEALIGFGMQGLWLAVSLVLLRAMWRAGTRRYSAVGG